MTRRRDPATRKARAAASAGKSLRAITIATGTRPPAAASRRRARAGGTAPISATRRAARSRSLRERGCTSTMRLPYTFPSRAMLAVVSVWRISLLAVPALSRVEPARTSGPGAGAMITFAVFLVCRRDAFAGPPAPDGLPKRARAGLHDTSTVFAPARRAAARAPCTNGVTPLAETPTTTSPPLTPARTARAPARVSSSARSRGWPARWRAARSGGRAPWRAWYHRLRYHLRVPAVLTGLDLLLRDRLSSLRRRAIGLLTHQASVNRRLEHAVTLLSDARGVRLTRLFAPEHGLWGAPQDHATIASDRDPVTGLPVISLYGARREPTPAMLAGLDALVVDLQDVGARYYTFQWTLALAMRACARAGVEVVVLDRPNPLGGAVVEGNVPDPAFASFVGLYPLPARPGLTLGELARWLAPEPGLGGRLRRAGMRGWRRARLSGGRVRAG